MRERGIKRDFEKDESARETMRERERKSVKSVVRK